jgi:isopenicillin N synthase-like dioxygenase
MQADAADLDACPVAEGSAALDWIPLIDVGELVRDSSSAAAASAIEQIAVACRTWGFFQVINHGIAAEQIAAVWRQTHALFALAAAEKMAIVRSRDNPWGFFNNELTKNQRDKKEVFDFTREGIDPIYRRQNRWPAHHPEFRSTMLVYLEACTELSLKLFEGFCLGLGLPANFMRQDLAERHTGFVRLNYFPLNDPLESLDIEHLPEADLGIHHHTDAGALTILLQDEVSGLQVYRDGFWYDVPTIPGALVVNTGDMMQVWSNDIYRAAIHRVLAMRERERYSIPFFFNPSAECRVSPLPTLTDDENPPRYDPIVWGDFRGKRADGDYADYGAEVQIAQYRR